MTTRLFSWQDRGRLGMQDLGDRTYVNNVMITLYGDHFVRLIHVE